MIKTFGSDNETTEVCDVVQLCLGSKVNKPITLNAYCVPMICAPLNHQKTQIAQSKYSHLASLELADEYSAEEVAPVIYWLDQINTGTWLLVK